MDVLSAAFDAAQPPETPTEGSGHGVCARCAASDGEMTATRTVVSKVFTAYDGWQAPGVPVYVRPAPGRTRPRRCAGIRT